MHIRDKECALCFTNGKGATKKAALASALGEYFERLSTNYFFADFWLGDTIAQGPFVHYPNENGSRCRKMTTYRKVFSMRACAPTTIRKMH